MKQKIACIGIGGEGVFYVAKYFHFLGAEVYGFDIAHTNHTDELEKLGVKITYENPTQPLPTDTTLFVYSPALPDTILESLETLNKEIEHSDVGTFTSDLCHKYESQKLSPQEIEAFERSEISPLYTLGISKMQYIAVTGTDGKTTTSSMIYHLLRELGYKPGLISTISAKIGDEDVDTGFHTTTPSPQELFRLIKKMEAAGCTHAVIETTSHGLAMGRVAGLKYDVAAYTNISSDHLDYHKTWENYFNAKLTLISEHLKPGATVFYEYDNEKTRELIQNTAKQYQHPVISYGIDTNANLQATNITEHPEISFELQGVRYDVPILGRYNVLNATLSIGLVSNLLKEDIKTVGKYIETFTTISGRMQIVQKAPFYAIVDFAHTANALTEMMKAARQLLSTEENKLYVVFGCAGKRDKTKRIPMGRAAGEYADVALLTAEDPRTESLKEINDAAEQGWKETASKDKILIRFDDDSALTDIRRSAIETALSLAKEGDVVVMAGKAHEKSLAIGNTEYPWSDLEETKVLLQKIAKWNS